MLCDVAEQAVGRAVARLRDCVRACVRVCVLVPPHPSVFYRVRLGGKREHKGK